MKRRAKLTMLSSMAGREISASLRQQAEWGIKTADLKDAIFDKLITELSDGEALRLAGLLRDTGLSVHCLSTMLFWDEVEKGEAHFAARHLSQVRRTTEVARILKAECIRLLAPATARRSQLNDAPSYMQREHPWIYRQMQEACSIIRDAGCQPVIENEVTGCVLTSPEEVCGFFEHLGSDARASYIWDIQNMWQCGSYPSLIGYEKLQPYLGMVHLKGGIEDPATRCLKYASALEYATWPVRELLARILADGRCSAICLNPSHGERRADFDYRATTEKDVAFIRRHFPEVE